MFFALPPALAALPELGERTRAAVQALLPGALTLLLPNPGHRYPLACGPDPDTLGLRVPAGPRCSPRVALPVARNRAPISPASPMLARSTASTRAIRAGADLVLDGGELPGTPSTVVDLRAYEPAGGWSVVREGAVGRGRSQRARRGGAANSLYARVIRHTLGTSD